MLVISAGPAASLNRVLFGNRVAVYIGLVSYPLYLWHWPLLAYARIVHGAEPAASLRAALLLLALALASWSVQDNYLRLLPARAIRAALVRDIHTVHKIHFLVQAFLLSPAFY